jgi:hypothetical protein
MKTSKFLSGLLLTTLIMIFCVACNKSDKDNVGPDNNGNNGNNGGNNGNATTLKPVDLLDYYVAVETSNKKLRVLYFVREGEKIMAYMDGLNIRRGQEVTDLSSNKLKFEFNEGVFYEFSFEKNASGIQYKGCTVTSTGVTAYSQMAKKADAPVFYKVPGSFDLKVYKYTKSETFCSSVDHDVFIYFDYVAGNDAWKYDGACGPTAFVSLYFVTAKAVWKSSDERVFGIAIHNWKDNNKPTMLLQTDIDKMQPDAVHTAIQM